MDFRDGFREISQINVGFELPEPETEWCQLAQYFLDWVDWLFKKIISEKPNIILVNQAKLLLSDKYFEWRSYAPKSHRDRIGSRGHNCIFQVFVQAYERLKLLELSLTPPKLFLPSEPPPPQIAGIFLGDLDER